MYTFYPWPCSYTVPFYPVSDPSRDIRLPRIRVAGEYF